MSQEKKKFILCFYDYPEYVVGVNTRETRQDYSVLKMEAPCLFETFVIN
jgi:hypothetical protein